MKITLKKCVNSLLRTYNLSHTVNYVTRIQNSSSTAMENIFVDSTRLSSSCTSPIVNGLSVHDAQFLAVNTSTTKVNLIPLKQRTRNINSETISQFQHILEKETLETFQK
jgi:hypothetical protein